MYECEYVNMCMYVCLCIYMMYKIKCIPGEAVVDSLTPTEVVSPADPVDLSVFRPADVVAR